MRRFALVAAAVIIGTLVLTSWTREVREPSIEILSEPPVVRYDRGAGPEFLALGFVKIPDGKQEASEESVNDVKGILIQRYKSGYRIQPDRGQQSLQKKIAKWGPGAHRIKILALRVDGSFVESAVVEIEVPQPTPAH